MDQCHFCQQSSSAAVLNPLAVDKKWAVTGNVVGRAEVSKQYRKVRQFYRTADIKD